MESEWFRSVLSTLPEGKKARVFQVNMGMGAKRHLANLGLVLRIEVIMRRSAPWSCHHRGSGIHPSPRAALGRGIATKVIVEMERVGHGDLK